MDNEDIAQENGTERLRIVYCDDGPELAKIVTESFLIYLKTAEYEKKREEMLTGRENTKHD